MPRCANRLPAAYGSRASGSCRAGPTYRRTSRRDCLGGTIASYPLRSDRKTRSARRTSAAPARRPAPRSGAPAPHSGTAASRSPTAPTTDPHRRPPAAHAFAADGRQETPKPPHPIRPEQAKSTGIRPAPCTGQQPGEAESAPSHAPGSSRKSEDSPIACTRRKPEEAETIPFPWTRQQPLPAAARKKTPRT